MSSQKPTRAWLVPLLLIASSLVACSDDEAETPDATSDGGAPGLDGGPVADSGTNGNVPDAAVDRNDANVAPTDAATPPLQACVERPGELARPPTGALPCELLPPGFAR